MFDRRMESMWNLFIVSWTILIHTLMLAQAYQQVFNIGVCYGMLGDDLPPPAEVVALYKGYGIPRMRLYDPNPDALEALRGQSIEVTLGVRNQEIQNIASGQNAAESWFATNMGPYITDVSFRFLVVGNEVIPGATASYVAPAMQNLVAVLHSHNLHDIVVTTSVASTVLQNTYPPSASEFTLDAHGPIVDILKVLSEQSTADPVLMVNLYPYFAYAADPEVISLEYAQSTAAKPVVRDGDLEYIDLFEAMLDGVYWAMEKAGFPDIGVAVSETGWPSAGDGNFTTPQLASIYNKMLLLRTYYNYGTPKRPGISLNLFIFAMFNENQKPAGVEQNWGLFYPNKEPVYSLFPIH